MNSLLLQGVLEHRHTQRQAEQADGEGRCQYSHPDDPSAHAVVSVPRLPAGTALGGRQDGPRWRPCHRIARAVRRPEAWYAVRSTVPGRRDGCHYVVMAGRVLLVEDDSTIGEVLTSSLRSHAYEVWWARTGAGGLARAGTIVVDLILLDLGLPDLDGVAVCRQLRRVQPGCVLVMLTARSAEMDVVVGLEAGADDYMVKPVRLGEFHARIRAHLRRGGAPRPDPRSAPWGTSSSTSAAAGSRSPGRELHLRPKEFDLLARLAEQPEVAHTGSG